MRILLGILFSLTLIAPFSPVYAQEDAKQALAEKMHDLRPVRPQVEGAIERFADAQPPNQREAFKTAMSSVLNIKAIEKASIDAYVQTFTVEELEAMVEYYSKPEAQSATQKTAQYQELLYPEIIKMLDKAAMRIRTGEN